MSNKNNIIGTRFDIENLVVETRKNKYGTEYKYITGRCIARNRSSVPPLNKIYNENFNVLAIIDFHSDDGSHGFSVVENHFKSMTEFEYMRIYVYLYMKVLRGEKWCWMQDVVNEGLFESYEASKFNLI